MTQPALRPPPPTNHTPRVTARQFLTKKLIDDLKVTWEEFGERALKIVAIREPTKFLQLAFGVLPKDVLVSVVEQRRPGGLSVEDWELMLRVLDQIKACVPAGAQAAPGEIFGVIENALRAHYAKPIADQVSAQSGACLKAHDVAEGEGSQEWN